MAETLLESAVPGPIEAGARQRLDSLDLLRGIGILGILLMNTQCMSMPVTAYYNPSDYGDLTGLNLVAWVLIHIVADMKFITIFSIMFGAGIALQAERSVARGLSPAVIHYRRMAVLLLFGLAHAYLLWFGDVLVMYCMCGALLFPMRRLPTAALIAIGVAFVGIGTFVEYDAIYGITAVGRQLQNMSNHLVGGVAGIDTELSAYRGGYWAEMHNRPWLSLENETCGFLRFSIWRCGGPMLIGMGLQRARFFHGGWTREAYATIAAFAIPAGWMITILGLIFNFDNQWSWETLAFTGLQYNYWGSLVTAMGYLSLGALLAIAAAVPARCILRGAVVPIRAVGRTALSNYIGQAAIATTIFYGHGLGYYGSVSRVGLVEITVAIWVVELTVSTLWLRRFKQGPLEWLWHRAVYRSGDIMGAA